MTIDGSSDQSCPHSAQLFLLLWLPWARHFQVGRRWLNYLKPFPWNWSSTGCFPSLFPALVLHKGPPLPRSPSGEGKWEQCRLIPGCNLGGWLALWFKSNLSNPSSNLQIKPHHLPSFSTIWHSAAGVTLLATILPTRCRLVFQLRPQLKCGPNSGGSWSYTPESGRLFCQPRFQVRHRTTTGINFDFASFAWSWSQLTLDGAGMNFATHGLDLSAGWLSGHFSRMPFSQTDVVLNSPALWLDWRQCKTLAETPGALATLQPTFPWCSHTFSRHCPVSVWGPEIGYRWLTVDWARMATKCFMAVASASTDCKDCRFFFGRANGLHQFITDRFFERL